MCGAIPPLPQHTFMAWCSVTGSTGTISVNILVKHDGLSELEQFITVSVVNMWLHTWVDVISSDVTLNLSCYSDHILPGLYHSVAQIMDTYACVKNLGAINAEGYPGKRLDRPGGWHFI